MWTGMPEDYFVHQFRQEVARITIEMHQRIEFAKWLFAHQMRGLVIGVTAALNPPPPVPPAYLFVEKGGIINTESTYQ